MSSDPLSFVSNSGACRVIMGSRGKRLTLLPTLHYVKCFVGKTRYVCRASVTSWVGLCSREEGGSNARDPFRIVRVGCPLAGKVRNASGASRAAR